MRVPVEEFSASPNLKRVLISLFGATAGQGVIWYTGQFYALFFLSTILKLSAKDSYTTIAWALLFFIPVFVLGYLLQYALGVFPFQHGWPAWSRFPVENIGPNSWTLLVVPTGAEWRHLLLPALTLASVSTALLARMARSAMLEVMGADHVRTARAKGLSETRVVLGHGLRNAAIPIVTLIGLDLGTLIGSAVLTETVFNWPGMGSAIQQAATSLDAPVVLGLTLVLVLVYLAVNLLVDLSYALFDPRIRYGRVVSG